MHADWQLTCSEPSGIEFVQQHKHGHNFAAVSIPLYCTVIGTIQNKSTSCCKGGINGSVLVQWLTHIISLFSLFTLYYNILVVVEDGVCTGSHWCLVVKEERFGS